MIIIVHYVHLYGQYDDGGAAYGQFEHTHSHTFWRFIVSDTLYSFRLSSVLVLVRTLVNGWLHTSNNSLSNQWQQSNGPMSPLLFSSPFLLSILHVLVLPCSSARCTLLPVALVFFSPAVVIWHFLKNFTYEIVNFFALLNQITGAIVFVCVFQHFLAVFSVAGNEIRTNANHRFSLFFCHHLPLIMKQKFLIVCCLATGSLLLCFHTNFLVHMLTVSCVLIFHSWQLVLLCRWPFFLHVRMNTCNPIEKDREREKECRFILAESNRLPWFLFYRTKATISKSCPRWSCQFCFRPV